MSSSTPFIQSGWANFRQPATIAVLASVGIHALFAFNIEKISLFPRTAQLPPSVELVELSTDQVEGIYPQPQKLSLSEVPVPPSLSSILGGGPTVPPFPSSPPPPSPTFITPTPSQPLRIPANPSSRRGSSLPPIVESYPDTYSNSYPDNYSLGTLPPSSNIPIYTPPIPPSIPDQNTFPDKNLEELDRAREFYEQLDGGNLVFSPEPPGADIFDPDRITPDEPGNEPPRFTPPESNNNLAVNPDFDPEPNPPVPPEEFRGSLLAKLEAGRNTEDNTEDTTNSDSNSPVFTQQPEQPPEGEVSERNLARIEGGSLFINWVLPILESYPNLQTASPIVFSDVYPANACEQQLNGEALVGVVVDSGGKILAGPELLLDSGYPVLDTYAVQKVDEFVSSQALGGNNPIAYQYAFNFNSENCGELSSPEQATPGNAQSTPDNSTPAMTESEGDVENIDTPPENVSETEPAEMEPEVPEAEAVVEPTEIEVPEPEIVEESTEVEVPEAEAIVEPTEIEPETPEAEAIVEPTEIEPETPEAEAIVEPTEIEVETSETEAVVEPTEIEVETPEAEAVVEPTEVDVAEPEATVEPTEIEVEVPEVEAIPNEFEEPVQDEIPAESDELMN